ncbi:MAG: alpha/beta hydrolase [Myxococcota bacterium]
MSEPWAHGWAELPGIKLHYVHAGAVGDPSVPLVLLLHGFPEFWYSWRHQIPALADAGYAVVAPDLRGFNLSEKPTAVRDYRVETLAADVEALVTHFGRERACVVGHDWGGMTAWWFAVLHPERLERLSVLNCPHPSYQLAMMSSREQVRKSRYMLSFQLPFGIPERAFRKNDFALLRKLLAHDPERPGAFSPADIERYVAAFSGDTPRTTMHYYRALLRRNPWAMRRKLRPIDRPVQVVWGAADRHLGIEFSEPSTKWVWDLRRDLIEGAGHCVQVDSPEKVTARLLDFLPGC